MPTIALVDDDRNILTSVSIALEAEGYRIQTYTDGASALDGLKHAPPDLAIFDIKMPRMDGMELLRRLRQKSDLPVIFLTSKDEEIDELFGLKMGADDFIRKPFSQRLLVERVKAVLRRSTPKDGATPKEVDARALERGHLRMDPERHTCTWKNDPVHSIGSWPSFQVACQVACATNASGFLETVAHAVEGLDHFETLVNRLELLAQALDVAVDGAVVHIDLVVIGRIHQGVAALHHARAGGQRLQDQELGDGQGHRLALPGAGMALGVHLELAALQGLRVGFLGGALVLGSEAA